MHIVLLSLLDELPRATASSVHRTNFLPLLLPYGQNNTLYSKSEDIVTPSSSHSTTYLYPVFNDLPLVYNKGDCANYCLDVTYMCHFVLNLKGQVKESSLTFQIVIIHSHSTVEGKIESSSL